MLFIRKYYFKHSILNKFYYNTIILTLSIGQFNFIYTIDISPRQGVERYPRGMQLDKKLVCVPGPRCFDFEHLFCRSINYHK